MTDASLRTSHIQDLSNFYADVNAGQLPAVSIVKPGWPTDGHPASSKLDIFEGFTKKVIDAVQSSPETWKTPLSSSHSTKAAVTGTPVTFNHSISLATVPVFL